MHPKMVLTGAIAGLVLAHVLAQQPGRSGQQKPIPPPQTPSFRTGVTLVPLDVRVLDNDDKPVADLMRGDFTVTEDGVRQEVAHFSRQLLAPAPPRPGLRARPDIQVFDATPQNQRVFLIIVGNGAFGGPSKTLDALIHFVRDRLLPQDQVALLAYNRATDFSANHEKVAQVLEQFRRSESGGRTALTRNSRSTPVESQACSVFEDPDTLDQSPALQKELGFAEYVRAGGGRLNEIDSLYYGIKYLRYMEGEKHLLVVTAQGLAGSSPRVGMTWAEVKHLADAATDARVVLDTIMTGGIPTNMGGGTSALDPVRGEISAPAVPQTSSGSERPGPSSPAHPPSPFAGGSAVAQAASAPGGVPTPGFSLRGLQQLADLRSMANLTGGQASIMEYTTKAVDRIDTATRVHYLLGYYPSNAQWDGRYRRIDVKVNRKGVTVLFRHGYHATTPPPPLDRRTILSQGRMTVAAESGAAIPDIRLAVKASEAAGAVPASREALVEVTIDASRILFSEDEGRFDAFLNVAVYCGDARGRLIGERSQTMDLQLTEPTYQRYRQEGIPYSVRIPLKGALGVVKVVVYDYDADLVGSSIVKVK
jgi:VWFA-related protein